MGFEAQPPDFLARKPSLDKSARTVSTWSPWISTTPFLTVPPAPQRALTFFAIAASVSSFSSIPAIRVTVFPARPDDVLDTRTRCEARGGGAGFAQAHLSAGHPQFGQRPTGTQERPGPEE